MRSDSPHYLILLWCNSRMSLSASMHGGSLLATAGRPSSSGTPSQADFWEDLHLQCCQLILNFWPSLSWRWVASLCDPIRLPSSWIPGKMVRSCTPCLTAKLISMNFGSRWKKEGLRRCSGFFWLHFAFVIFACAQRKPVPACTPAAAQTRWLLEEHVAATSSDLIQKNCGSTCEGDENSSNDSSSISSISRCCEGPLLWVENPTCRWGRGPELWALQVLTIALLQ